MRKILLLTLLLIVFSSFSVKHDAFVLPTTGFELTNKLAEKNMFFLDKMASMKTKEAERILGRKLTLKEKIALKLAQHKIKKGLKTGDKEKSSKGQTAFILSLIGLGLLFVPYLALASIPLAIIAIVQGSQAKKENPNDGKAKTAIILGIVTLGLVALAIIIVLAVLATFSWGWG